MEKKVLKPFEARVIREYCELRERYSKLKESINKGDEFKKLVGEKEYGLLCRQFEAMDMYIRVLKERIDDLGIYGNVPSEWSWSRGDKEDEMLSRDKVITKAYTDCLEEMYQKSQPAASYLDYINQYRSGELTDNDRIYERHYLSQAEYEYIVDKYVHAYGMDKKWFDYIDTVVQYFEKGATKDKWIEDYEDEYGMHPGHRGYEKLEDIKTIIKDYLDANTEETNKVKAEAIKELVLKRIDYCKNFYCFDREEGNFKASVALGASPTSNPDTVKKYWKEKGVDVEIIDKDPDTLWERDYYGDQYEAYVEDRLDDEEFIDEE